MHTWKTLLATLTLPALLGAADSRWYHTPQIQTDSRSIWVDFQKNSFIPPGDVWSRNPGVTPTGPTSSTTEATEVWLHFYKAGLDNKRRVNAMVLNYREHNRRGDRQNVTDWVEAELRFAESGHFTAKLPRPVPLHHQFNDGYALTVDRLIRQEIVVWVDGQVYKDPRTGRNFALDMLHATPDPEPSVAPDPGPFRFLTPELIPTPTDYGVHQPKVENASLFAGKRVAILAAHGVEIEEIEFPYTYLKQRGAQVEILVPDWSRSPKGELGVVMSAFIANVGFAKADRSFSSVLKETRAYDLIVLTGGAWNAQIISTDGEAKKLVQEHFASGRPIAAICKGTELLIPFGIAKKGVTVTGPEYARIHLINSGATVLDQPGVSDCKKLLTSRDPRDLLAFVEGIKTLLLK